MVSSEFRKEIMSFLASLNFTGNLGYQLRYDNDIKKRILNHYLPTAQRRSEETKRECIQIMENSCKDNFDHSKLADWRGALANIIWFCILPTESFHEIEEDRKKEHGYYEEAAISSVIRFSRWYHTTTGFWKRFQPYAQEIGNLLWGNMEVLNKYNP